MTDILNRRDFIRRAGLVTGSLALSSSAVTLLDACSVGSTATKAGPLNLTLNVGAINSPPGLDPHVGTSSEYAFFSQMYDTLVFNKPGTATDVAPVLAKTWSIDPAGATYTFDLRQDVKFHDGTPFNATAVKVNVERILAMKTGPYWALAGVKNIEVVSPYAVRFTIGAGGPNFLKALVLVRMVSPTALQLHAGNDNARSWLATNEAGSGPYVLNSFVQSESIVMSQFKEYWGGWTNDQFTHVNFPFVHEPTTQELMLLRGDLDIAWTVPQADLRSLAAQKNINVVSAIGNNELNIRMNVVAGPTSDVRVRQAFAYSFDYDGYINVMAGKYTRTKGPVPKIYIGGYEPQFPYAYDPTKAKELFQAAGYSPSNKAQVTLYINTEQDQSSMATILKSGAEGTGLASVSIVPKDAFALLNFVQGWVKTRDPKAIPNMFGLWTNARLPDPYAYLWYLYATAAQGGIGRNAIVYSNSAVDSGIMNASIQVDPKKQQALYEQAIQTIVNDCTDINCGIQAQLYVARKDVLNIAGDPNWYPSNYVYNLRRAAS